MPNKNTLFPLHLDNQHVDWIISDTLIPYPLALEKMQNRVESIIKGEKAEAIWLLEHPPLYTAGTSARSQDLITPDKFDIYQTGRGGQYTYHGPGQKVIYVMLDLNKRKQDIRKFITELEYWIIDLLAELTIPSKTYTDRVGIWVDSKNVNVHNESKIAAIGIRLKKWVSFHGVSLNIEPDLSHFDGIIPCGISQHGVTSLHQLGHIISHEEVESLLQSNFETRFGPTQIIDFEDL